MSGLPTLLLLMVVVTHYGYDIVGALYPGHEVAAATAWHLVFRAFEAALLYLIVWSLVPWRPAFVRCGASLVCAWGALESLQIAVCRLQFPMDRKPPSTPLYTGMCDAATGWPIYMLTIGLALVCCVAGKGERK
jgi:hypothetical protein